MATTEVEGQVHDVDRRQSRLEGMLEMMIENQREYRQDMRNLASRMTILLAICSIARYSRWFYQYLF